MDFARAYDPIRALEGSWALIKRSPLPLLAGGIVLMLTDGHGNSGIDLDGGGGLNLGEVLALLGVCGCCALAGLLIHAWISLGVANVVEMTRKGARPPFSAVFDGRGRFFEMVLGRVLVILIWLGSIVPFVLIALGAWYLHEGLRVEEGVVVLVAILAALAYLPAWLWFLLGISLWRPAVAIDGLAPTAAIQRSWELVRGNRLRLLLYWVAISLFSFLGICLCCVGVLLTGPMMQIAQFESYLELTQPGTSYAASMSSGMFGAKPVPPAEPPASPVEPPPPAG
jgi:hypothetical protein